jgi:hypothetical protein
MSIGEPTDRYRWYFEQAEALRAWRWHAVDVERLAEEVLGLRRGLRTTAHGCLRNLIECRLAEDTGGAVGALDELEDLLHDARSLRTELEVRYGDAAITAAAHSSTAARTRASNASIISGDASSDSPRMIAGVRSG